MATETKTCQNCNQPIPVPSKETPWGTWNPVPGHSDSCGFFVNFLDVTNGEIQTYDFDGEPSRRCKLDELNLPAWSWSATEPEICRKYREGHAPYPRVWERVPQDDSNRATYLIELSQDLLILLFKDSYNTTIRIYINSAAKKSDFPTYSKLLSPPYPELVQWCLGSLEVVASKPVEKMDYKDVRIAFARQELLNARHRLCRIEGLPYDDEAFKAETEQHRLRDEKDEARANAWQEYIANLGPIFLKLRPMQPQFGWPIEKDAVYLGPYREHRINGVYYEHDLWWNGKAGDKARVDWMGKGHLPWVWRARGQQDSTIYREAWKRVDALLADRDMIDATLAEAAKSEDKL